MRYTILFTLFFISIGLVTTTGNAEPTTNSPYLLLAQNSQNLNAAIHTIKQRTKGRILSAKTINKKGKRIHKIKVLLPSGKVQTFKVKAN